MDTVYWLPIIWTALLAAAVAFYVVLDGFDLGIGLLFPFAREEKERDLMMNSIAPFWDGNETWLVLGGGGLFVAFPAAYAVLMPAAYLPVIFMLLALVFRGVAFEFRAVAKPRHQFWDAAFAGGSLVAAVMQGIILGTLLQGIPIKDGAYAGGPLIWLAPFPLFTGAAVAVGYALLGATWLILKTEGGLAARARRWAKLLLPALLAALAIVSLWTPLAFERVFARWFSWPNTLYLAPVPLLTAFTAWISWRSLARGEELTPFLTAIALFLLGYLGLAVSTVPYLIPPSLDIWQAAAPVSSQMFMLVGVVILLPLVLGYTVFVYWTFRGKVRVGEGYHG